jgi:hypothetical protein
MKPITLHPTSLLAGLALATLAFFAMAQSPQPATPTLTRPAPSTLIRGQDMVVIRAGTPFTVPPNKWFILTALGDSAWGLADAWNVGPSVTLFLNGAPQISKTSADAISYVNGYSAYAVSGANPSMVEVPRGFSAVAGDVITVSSGAAWGYLSDS